MPKTLDLIRVIYLNSAMKRKPVLGEIIYDLNIGNAARNHLGK